MNKKTPKNKSKPSQKRCMPNAIRFGLTAMRPRQWTKNLIVFAAPLFAFQLFPSVLFDASVALILFCCASSSFYLFNDIADRESDRQHPIKCKRPIAAGLIPVPVAFTLATFLLALALIGGAVQAPALGLVILIYALLQVAYNLLLKHKVIADVVAIALGFVLRAYAGAAATGISVSPWFLLCTAMLALFLGVEKRKAELRLVSLGVGKPRKVLHRYSSLLLSRMENTVTTSAVVSYALWSSGPDVGGAKTPWMMVTIPFVLYGVFRYQLLSDPQEIERYSSEHSEAGGQTERPEEVLLRDRPMLLTVTGWVLTSLLILALHKWGVL